MSEGLRYGIEHGKEGRDLVDVKAYDPKVNDKLVKALQDLKDLEYPMVDQLERLKDALIPVYPEVRNPKDPCAVKEEIMLEDAIAANIIRAEKKKKCRVVCRTHDIGSDHHSRSNGIPVSVPTVVPYGLAILLGMPPLRLRWLTKKRNHTRDYSGLFHCLMSTICKGSSAVCCT
ncbi:hypothetical protein Tco_0910972 [Tanacetum coccineum]|uniref:Uncharacterized protein n=1 Tax=Tanacetum coccineum TaxID=301880 RepID=A0ABQ5CW40_9ASTR